MLYLAPPFHIINQVTVFRDHEDPLQWYYLPGPPRLTQIRDTVTGTLVPQLQVIEFRGTAGTGGFLNFDVNLGIDPEALDEIRDEIKRLENLRSSPRLAPVPLIDGTVKLMLFDQQTGDVPAVPAPTGPAATDPTEATGPKFVLKLSHHAKPALYGDNQAAFSCRLTEDGVKILKKALQGEMSPIGVVFSLDYLALRPAYSVRLNIDWDRVQKHFDTSFGTDTIFYQSEITKAIDELIDNRTIVLEVDTFVPEGEDSELMARRDQAVDEVRDMLTGAFFEPSLNPVEPKEDAWDKIEHLAKTASALAVTGGWGALVGFSYRKIDRRRIDRKRLDFNIRERTTVKKTIYPQGHLSGLFRVLREPGIDLSRFVLSVDLDDPWFARRKLQVISRADYAADQIASIHVHLDYGGQTKSAVLDAATKTADIEWNSLLAGGAMRQDVTARYTVNFRDLDGTERPVTLQSPAMTETGEYLEINPRELYSLVPIPVQALNFPWERYSHIEVQLQYADPERGIRQADSYLLKKEDVTETIWKMFVLNPALTRFRYKLIYRAVDHRDVEMPWIETDEERLTIRDPFPQKRTLEIVPVFDWTKVDRAFVDVSYEDPEHDIVQEASFEFNSAVTSTQTFLVALKDPDRRTVGYRVTVIYKDGTVADIPESFTLQRRITLRDDMRGHKIVTIRPESGDFAGQKLRDIVVKAKYEDAERSLIFEDEFTLKSGTDRAHFEYDFAAGGLTKYRYQIVRRFTNGLSKTVDWKPSDEDEIIVPLK
ncbi:hypothetical protein [Paenibacillus oceani]|uniref:Uncharacterized protein n=1 Tax=Paenibacillus oceani TaxID=2772510 RepID=A0A927H2Y4_9BACL|nr:hypothetical protein [Paenibacillus oceani]MBD2864934.1 hypothetical protein [Paenibacillus oceani]